MFYSPRVHAIFFPSRHLLLVLNQLLPSHRLDDGTQLGDYLGRGDLFHSAFREPGAAQRRADGALKLRVALKGEGQQVHLVRADGTVSLL